MKGFFKKFYKKYMESMKSQADKMEIPKFPEDEIKRYRIVFSGNVQGVGFRYETWCIAEKLKLTGFCENLPNGDVRAEIQGQNNKIEYLIDCLQSVKRIEITKMEKMEMPLKEDDGFVPIY